MSQLTVHRLKYLGLDLLSTEIGWMCFNLLRYCYLTPVKTFTSLGDFLCDTNVILGQILIPVGMTVLYAVSGSYNRSATFYKSRLEEVLNAAIVSATGMLGVWFTVLYNDSFAERLANYEMLFCLYLCLFVPTALMRILFLHFERRHIRRGDYAIRTLIVGYNPSQKHMLRRIIGSRNTSGVLVSGIVCSDSASTEVLGIPCFDGDDIPGLCRRLGIQSVVLLGSNRRRKAAELVAMLYDLRISIYITPQLSDAMGVRPRLKSVVNEPLVCITSPRVSAAATNMKRIGDIAVSASALVLLSPVFLILSILVKTSSPGPVFYRQTRIGLHRRPFEIIKFRSMYVDAEKDGPGLSCSDDPRITPAGRFLRRYHLDELPQFWNVLKGEMSLVGPRPERDFYLRQMMQTAPASALLFQLRPGITSWGMVKYGYASSVSQMVERLYYDLLYLENISFGTDLKILCHTVDAVLHGNGK